MTLALAIAIYFIIWWLTLFLVLPFQRGSQAESGEVVPGTPASAPAQMKLLRTVLWTTLIATMFFALTYAILVVPTLRAWFGGLFGL